MKRNVFSPIKAVIGMGAVVGGLALTAGPITAATTIFQPGAAQAPAAPLPPSATRVETAILADDKPEVFARSRAIRDALGMPGGAKNRGLHVKDGPRKAEYDEVTETDAGGQPLSLTQLDAAGRLLLAVRFDDAGTATTRLGRDAALKRASDGIKAAGINPAGAAQADSLEGVGGWDVRWTRTSGGFSVRGDEVRVHVRDDGAIGSVGQVSHDLAAAPVSRLTKDQATAKAVAQTQAWSNRSGARFSIGDMSLQWAGPNAAFDASKIGAPEAPMRLSWVVNIVPQGDAASYARLVVLFVDAGDGSVIGGDVVE